MSLPKEEARAVIEQVLRENPEDFTEMPGGRWILNEQAVKN
jgi:hypothetical protein